MNDLKNDSIIIGLNKSFNNYLESIRLFNHSCLQNLIVKFNFLIKSNVQFIDNLIQIKNQQFVNNLYTLD